MPSVSLPLPCRRLLVKKQLQAALAEQEGSESGSDDDGEGGEKGDEEDPEEKLLREMGEIKDRCEHVGGVG
jgi:hypothetical protein